MQYPNIAQPQYGFAPTTPMMPSMSDMPPAMMGFKEGGLASLPKMAQKVRAAGREGDTVLAHITPEEAMMLRAMGGSGTINPETGLPEFFVKKLVNTVTKPIKGAADFVGDVVKGGVKAIAPILRPIAPILPFLPIPGIGALSSLAVKSLLTGIASGLDKRGNFNLKRGITSGALAYGLGSLMSGANAAPNAAGTGGPYDISDVGSLGDLGVGAASTPTLPTDTGAFDISALSPPPAAPTATPSFNPAIDDLVVPGGSGVSSGLPMDRAPIVQSSAPIPGAGANAPAPTTMGGIGNLASELGSTALKAITPTSAMDALKIASTGATAYGSIKSLQELEAQKKEAERILAAQEGKKQEDIKWAQGLLAEYPLLYRQLSAEDVKSMGLAGGGLAGLNAFKSGGQPRFLRGGGDGMSDDIPAMIGGRQKAALSDGEFVIPADVVSHLGNGSSRAGAKKLYSMMDNIRKARTGKKRQAPEVRADRYMPA